jgi:hypothetical protein
MDMQWNVDVGLWNGQVFPGANSGSAAPSLHAGVAVGDWNFDGFVARFEPKGRGAVIASTNGAHTHSAPVCDALLKQIVCFDGGTDLAGASLRWNSHAWPVTASAAVLQRRDSGTLNSANGVASYVGDNTGMWADVIWRFHAKAEMGVRTERLLAQHSLTGLGATLVANEAGFSAYRPATRTSLMGGYSPNEALDVRVEVGQEDVSGTQSNFVVMRLVARVEKLFKK